MERLPHVSRIFISNPWGSSRVKVCKLKWSILVKLIRCVQDWTLVWEHGCVFCFNINDRFSSSCTKFCGHYWWLRSHFHFTGYVVLTSSGLYYVPPAGSSNKALANFGKHFFGVDITSASYRWFCIETFNTIVFLRSCADCVVYMLSTVGMILWIYQTGKTVLWIQKWWSAHLKCMKTSARVCIFHQIQKSVL